LRLQDAALALAEGVEDLSRLAHDLGFSSHSHFAQAFRAQFGIPPSRFRSGVRLQPDSLSFSISA
jgi:AraC-like DNA-binding protein